MRSKQEIERQLEHFKSSECHKHGTPENETWIAALEWVLGNDQHQKHYTEWIDSLEAFIPNQRDTITSKERQISLALQMALERLR